MSSLTAKQVEGRMEIWTNAGSSSRKALSVFTPFSVSDKIESVGSKFSVTFNRYPAVPYTTVVDTYEEALALFDSLESRAVSMHID